MLHMGAEKPEWSGEMIKFKMCLQDNAHRFSADVICCQERENAFHLQGISWRDVSWEHKYKEKFSFDKVN